MGATTHISSRLLATIRRSNLPAYRIAQATGIHPSRLSQLVRGLVPVKKGDPGVLRLAALFGISAEEAFAPSGHQLEHGADVAVLLQVNLRDGSVRIIGASSSTKETAERARELVIESLQSRAMT